MQWKWLAGGAVLGGLGLAAASCEPASGGSDADACDLGRTLCSGECVSLNDHPAHCGGCGQACGTGQSCVAGACACLAGLTACGTSCVDLQSDGASCGQCGRTCAPPLVCSLGECTERCAPGLTQCGSSCVNLSTSVAHCGQCGSACLAGTLCVGGSCSCPAGQTLCAGRCTDTTIDPEHCGSCGTVCSGGACRAGRCDAEGSGGSGSASGGTGGAEAGGAGAGGTGGGGTGGSGGTSPGTPTGVCEEPEPWPTPATPRVVGDGSAASCTEQALRDAVDAGGFVRFDCGQAPVTLSIATAIEVGAETVIDGEGTITLDGGGTSQIFLVRGKLSVRNLRFVNGKAPESEDADGIGGAVAGAWRSEVEVIGCTFEDNTAGRGGGAVAVWTGSSLTIVRSEFRRNHSWYGGAVYSLWSPLKVVNSEFIDNSTFVNNGGGAIGTDGALDPDYREPREGTDTVGGTVEICGSRFQNNRAYGAGGAAFIWVYPPDKVIIDRSTVEGNTLGKDADGGGLSLGGGMRVSNGEITIRSTSFLANSGETHGGALYLDCEPTCTITNSTFYSNEVTDGYGGAIFGDRLRVNNVTFANNFANGHGGALFGGSDWVLKNSVFLDNRAGNPWGQAYSCAATGTGDHVLQWVTDFDGAGSDPCIEGVIAADPALAEPAANGGPTFTMLPRAGSPVLGAGRGCEALDQRGEPRDPNACDLGAVELP